MLLTHSTLVNFTLIFFYLLIAPYSRSTFGPDNFSVLQVGGRLAGWEPADSSSTSLTLLHISFDCPHHTRFDVQRCVKDETPTPTLKLALAAIRMSAWDSDVFYKFKQVSRGCYRCR